MPFRLKDETILLQVSILKTKYPKEKAPFFKLVNPEIGPIMRQILESYIT